MFNAEKLIQTCNYLLKKNDSTLNYTKLIKLLYLADKESLKSRTMTITGDVYVSMKNGVVLSKTYDLIKGRYNDKDIQNLWNSRFSLDSHSIVSLSEKIPESELSPFEKNILDQIESQFHAYDFWQMIDYIHENCPEWQDPGNTSIPIDFEDVLRSLDIPDDEVEWIVEENNAFDEEEKLFVALGQES